MAELPEMIGKYKIVSLVAKGGMGAVFKAVHPTLKRFVIIKKLTIRGNASVIERFKREAQMLLDCNDPHIVHLFDYFKEANSHYIVLEFVDGMSLDVLIKKRRYLSGCLSLYVFLEACKGLKYAHDNGIIHRDIKPGNILISKTGEVKLADFGIAATDSEEDSSLTKEGMTLGTPSYMPPEQFENSKNVDKRADIYSMGIMLYEMVTGKKPFPGNFAPDTIMMIQKGRYVRADKLNPDIPHVVSALIRKLVQPNPRKRYQDLDKVIHNVTKFLKRYRIQTLHDALVSCMTVNGFEEPLYKPRTKKRAVFFTVFLLAAIAGFGSWYVWTKGYVHRYALSESYGALKISLRLPAALKESGDMFLKAELYVNDRSDMPKAKSAPVVFTPAEGVSGDIANNFTTNTVFLSPGSYRAKILVEQRIYWYSFSLESISEAKRQGRGDFTLALSFDEIPVRPINARMEAYDAVTGKNISASATYYVQSAGLWVPLATIASEKLMTGSVHRFRAEASGYFSELFSLKISPFQDELRMRADLVPLSGKLTLRTDGTKISLRINGKDSVVLGGEAMIREGLTDYRGGNRTWVLPSGRYDIEVKSGKNSGSISVAVTPDTETKISINGSLGTLVLQKE